MNTITPMVTFCVDKLDPYGYAQSSQTFPGFEEAKIAAASMVKAQIRTKPGAVVWNSDNGCQLGIFTVYWDNMSGWLEQSQRPFDSIEDAIAHAKSMGNWTYVAVRDFDNGTVWQNEDDPKLNYF